MDQLHPAQSVADPEALAAQVEELERRLDVFHVELARSHRLTTLGMLVATIAHEFNNILTPVLTYAQLAKAHPADAALAQKAIDKAEAGAAKASAIAASILSLAKDSDLAADPDAEARIAEVETASREAASFLDGDLMGGACDVRLECTPGLRAAITPTALQQVLLNLTLNARKALGARRGQIRIEAGSEPGAAVPTAECYDPAERHIAVRIHDTGPGLPDAVRRRLFTPFSPGASGTGLGLSICRRLVEEVGGAISVERTGREGTTFLVRLPMASI